MRKKIILFVSVIAGLAVTSCSSDNSNEDVSDGVVNEIPEPGDNQVSIVGKWEYSKVGVNVDGEDVLENWYNYTGCKKDNIEFL